MEIAFKTETIRYLDWCLNDVQNAEQTLEIKLPEGMGDVGQVLCAWGQPIARGKEWHSGYVSFNGGMMVWVLYAPEDGSENQCIEGWIPFQLRWDLPEGTQDGEMRFALRSRFVDARSTSARKIMVRAGLGVLAEALVPSDAEISTPEGSVPKVELRREKYPLRLAKLAGEKTFLLDEKLTVPQAAPQPKKLRYYTVSPEITDQKVLTDKVVFRGNGNLHLCYEGEDGKLHSWDFPLAFSQLGELEESFGQEALTDVIPAVTSLELEMEEDGGLALRCGLVGQYLVQSTEMVELITDAYAPGREVSLEMGKLALPVILDSRSEMAEGQGELAGNPEQPGDLWVSADLPSLRRRGDQSLLNFQGTAQMLWHDESGALKASLVRWEKELPLGLSEDSQLIALCQGVRNPHSIRNGEKTQLSWENPVKLTALGRTDIPMVLGIALGGKRETQEDAPSLIIRRVGDDGLWEIAKNADSTMEAIRKANKLTADPQPGQMLLIPIAGEAE